MHQTSRVQTSDLKITDSTKNSCSNIKSSHGLEPKTEKILKRTAASCRHLHPIPRKHETPRTPTVETLGWLDLEIESTHSKFTCTSRWNDAFGYSVTITSGQIGSQELTAPSKINSPVSCMREFQYPAALRLQSPLFRGFHKFRSTLRGGRATWTCSSGTLTAKRGSHFRVAHALSARKLLLDILNLPPLPIVFPLYRASVWVFIFAVLQSRLTVTRKW